MQFKFNYPPAISHDLPLYIKADPVIDMCALPWLADHPLKCELYIYKQTMFYKGCDIIMFKLNIQLQE